MSAAFDRLQANYYNGGLWSGANPGGLSGPGAMRENWPPHVADFVTVSKEAADSAAAAAASAIGAAQAPTATASSTDPIIIPAAVPANVSFTFVEANRVFVKGQTAIVVSFGSPLNSFIGPITAFDPVLKTMTVRALFFTGAGTFNDMRIGLSPPIDGTLTGRVAALEQANALQRDAALFHAKVLF